MIALALTAATSASARGPGASAGPRLDAAGLRAGVRLGLDMTGPRAGLGLDAAGPPAGLRLDASLAPAEIAYGAILAVRGRLSDAGQGLAGVPLALQADAYPFRGFVAVAHLASAPDGSFSFTGIRPDRNTRLRVVAEGSPVATGPVLAATVDPKVTIHTHSLGPGRVHISLRIRHTPVGKPRPASVWWFLSARGSRVFRLAAVSASRELSRETTYASIEVNPPARRFSYRVCLNPSWESAMGPTATHRSCPKATFVTGRGGS